MTHSEKKSGVHVFNHFGENVLAAFSGRKYDAQNRDQFLEALRIHPSTLVSVKQEHTSRVLFVDRPPRHGGHPTVADALVTDQAGIALSIRTADCLPVFYWDSEKHAVGIAHAGWRGIHQGIVGEMVRTMTACFGSIPETIRVAFGPAIRKCCYEVGEEFQKFFPRFYSGPAESSPEQKIKGFMDLIAAATDQLLHAGIRTDLLADCGICTSCQNDRFFSARRGQTDERILSVIQLIE